MELLSPFHLNVAEKSTNSVQNYKKSFIFFIQSDLKTNNESNTI